MNRRPPLPRDRQNRRPGIRRVVRDRNRKKPDYSRWVRVGLAGVLAAQCLRVAFASPRLNLQEVRVSGTQRLTAEEVSRLSGIRPGQNIFHVNLVRVSDRLRQIPFVREAVVSREFPHAVLVEVRERTPEFQVSAGEKLLDVDDQGVVFQEAAAPNPDLPQITVPAEEIPALGRPMRPALARAVWDCERLAREEDLELRNMLVDASGELWLNVATFPNGEGVAAPLRVRVGRLAELPQKFRDIRTSLAAWPDLTSRAAYLNVMCAGRPAYLRMTQETLSP